MKDPTLSLLANSIFNFPELYRNLYAPFEPEMLETAHKDYGKAFLNYL
jgi:hypothetical protein